MDGDSHPLSKSCLVVAHPDDELMWFSSVLEKIDQVIFCFADSPSFPKVSKGRADLVSQHPCRDLKSLGVTEAEVYDSAHWPEPENSEIGLRISQSHSAPSKRYRENFSLLEAKLSPLLKNYENVYTHNPWGEYGHEEHVQVFRVVDACRESQGFNMWCPGYVGTRSRSLMVREVRRLSGVHHVRPTDNALQRRLYDLYLKYSAWTWPRDMSEWFPTEAMLLVAGELVPMRKPRYFPMNFIDMEPPNRDWRDKSLRQLRSSISRRIRPRPHSEEF